MKKMYISILLFLFLFRVKEIISEEKNGVGSTTQNWGYATVREGAHYFWWLYYASSSDSTWKDKPLLISLTTRIQKGASGSNNFDHIGPLDMDLNPRDNTWLNDFNILFIDNILDSGFSYVDNKTNYAKTSDQMSEDLFEVIRDFFNTVPEFITIPTYMMGENIGTVIAAKAALIWAQAQKIKKIESNFKAVVLGAPWISLTDVTNFWTLPSNKGKFSEKEFKEIENNAKEINKALENEEFDNVFSLFIRQIATVQTYLKLNNIFNLSPNIMTNYSDVEKDKELKYLMNSQVKNLLQLDHEWENEVNYTFLVDFGNAMAKPIKDTVDQLLKTGIRVIIIAGQNDLIIPSSSVESWVNNFNWAHKKAFQATAQSDINDGILVKKYRNLQYYLIEAGHLLMVDNPQNLRRIVKEVTEE